ncbi:tyrosine-type recombinase/integrase [Streptomyces sp. NPDC048387]|uniref:tyrosine-type recombinase/integrase n=1 Tax=Streptomyces sp. NPDC048387 TaxID=3365542 RepID=UPI00371D23D6
MSTASSAATRLAAPPDLDLEAWTAWLTDRVDPAWRPGEWDARTLFFDGDPGNDRTVAQRCVTAACTSISNSRGLCSPCIREWEASGLDKATFIAEHVPDRRKGSPGRFQVRCLVERDGQQCAQPRYCQGLCITHYRVWSKKAVRESGIAADVWARTGPEPCTQGAPPCVVMRCEQERRGLKRLCGYHHNKYKREAPAEPVEEWIDRQTPFLFANQFSLVPFSPVMRLEILYGLQQRDARGAKADPTSIRLIAKTLEHLPHLLGTDLGDLLALTAKGTSNNADAHVKEIHRTLHNGHEEMCGIKPRDKHIWDLTRISLPSTQSKSGRRRATRGTVDFTAISQPWLRELALTWARDTDPTAIYLRDTVRVAAMASGRLEARPGGGADPSRLGGADMDTVVDGIRVMRRGDGEVMARGSQRNMAHNWFNLLDFGRRTGLMNGFPTAFSRQRWHDIGHDDDEDNEGKAVPEPVIAQLDRHLDFLGDETTYGQLSVDQIRQMFRTAYIVLRDTGRRPGEVCSLYRTCVKDGTDGPDLIWDNHKSKRHRRRLPIAEETATAIREWLPVRATLNVPAESARYLFPAITADSAQPHMNTSSLSQTLRHWVDSIPRLTTDVPGPDGTPLPFDRSLIYPYAFRHSYAQRHADAGVAPDVLRDLMDHRNFKTTMGYYKVSLKRKREAVTTMRTHVVDRAGNPAPIASNTAYEARSVAVPFGNCREPSNVKAGGSACPIRFQCAGCGFYRPDPSYLPAIEEHVNSLRADRFTAEAMDADPFVTRNLSDQIDAFQQVLSAMRKQMDEMSTEERQEVEEASAVLRKARAGRGRTTLPLTVINRRSS